MERKRLLLIAILLASLVATVPVLADAPMVGTVHEGDSVPGIALGFSRAQVEDAYGQPNYWQSYAIPDDFAFCTFPVSEGNGSVSVRYRGADDGLAHNSPDDRVVYIGWGESVSGWTTTAGINTTLAKANPDAVIVAYPEAEVTYLSPGFVQRVVDWLQGVEIKWTYDSYTGRTHVSMNIFVPLASLPDALETHVETIELFAYRDRGLRKINAWVEILDEHGRAATSATVDAIWKFPDGSTQPAFEDFVGINGVAFFQLIAPNGRSGRGIYELRIDNVALDGHTFDRADSDLNAGVYIK